MVAYTAPKLVLASIQITKISYVLLLKAAFIILNKFGFSLGSSALSFVVKKVITIPVAPTIAVNTASIVYDELVFSPPNITNKVAPIIPGKAFPIICATVKNDTCFFLC